MLQCTRYLLIFGCSILNIFYHDKKNLLRSSVPLTTHKKRGSYPKASPNTLKVKDQIPIVAPEIPQKRIFPIEIGTGCSRLAARHAFIVRATHATKA
jgi:hypothetical protein